ncbi:biotin carboxyl carrier protein of acetyl-CoA carboxylase 1, chloroplastic isoform X1 [Jatropha curcas]|uniref:biotin carboxyl carrier protein of acetyl-CoA carboxylase 1, chloroplastic isoform X1 n=1 Tax=Jatropha curcas TaxID=180498 RepID=UPI0005FB749D|nr:biotin carboxyl carrier protein of acetyl-CoA carboxylase 1, chloroplastic isoform X1 [Jatropha curcas]
MASSLSTTAAASASAVAKTSANLPNYSNCSLSRVSFRLSPKPKLRFFAKGLQPGHNNSTLVKAQLNEVRFFQQFSFEDLFSNFRSFLDMLLGSSVAFKVAVDGPSNAAASPPTRSGVPSQEKKDAKPSNEPSAPALATEESISEFITQVASLVKLVDSRDIVELQLKQLDCEVIIRKKEALPQPPSPAPVVMMHSPSQSPPPLMHSAPPAASSTAPSPASSAPPPPPSAPAVKPSKSSHPPLKCPMAGTFYRSSAPGEPPFVKVGDKVQKGQVLCIIEAMKLMNEIEADQSGTIVEILAEDGKSVSVDMPLFVIEP